MSVCLHFLVLKSKPHWIALLLTLLSHCMPHDGTLPVVQHVPDTHTHTFLYLVKLDCAQVGGKVHSGGCW